MAWIQKCIRKVAEEKILSAATLSVEDQAALTSLTAKGNHAKTHAFIISSSELRKNAELLHVAFPAANHPNVVHAFAAKANPLRGVLEVAKAAGLGCETASFGEVMMAQKVFLSSRVVYDSPVKSIEELRHCCYSADATTGEGMYLINVDNFPELDRIAALHKERPIKATVGIRVNPQLGAGAIGQLSTALATSKFGIGLHDHHAALVKAFADHKDYLRALHVHTGSQGIGLKMMVAGVKAIVDLADEVNASAEVAAAGGGVSIIDIGGGLPVNFASDEFTPTFGDYSAQLQSAVPSLFSGRYALVTEFGRSLVAKAGILVSRVEYVKTNGGRRIIQQHIGADLAIRTVWQPENWRLRIDVFDGASGELKTADPAPTDVAGPCCLGGDLLCSDRSLPLATELVDLVVAKDVGGYYHSAYSYYNLRAMPPCYLYDEDTDTLTLINAGQSVAQTVAMFD